MKPWEEIKDELYQQEEPLSEADLALMERKLGGGGAGWYKYGLLLLLLLLTVGTWWWFTPFEKEVIKPSASGNVNNEVPASAEMKPVQTSQPEATEAEAPAGAVFEATSISKEAPSGQSQSNLVEEALVNRLNETYSAIAISPKGLADLSLFAADSLAIKAEAVQSGEEKDRAPFSGKNTKRFSAKIFAGYSLALNQPELSLDPDAQHYRFEELASRGQLGGGVHLGAELHYRLYKNFSLGLGFDFFELQRQYNFNHRIDDIPVIDSASGHIIGYLTRAEAEQISARGQSSFGYLGLPFAVDYSRNLSTRWSLRGEARYTHYLNIYARGRELDPQSLTPVTLSRGSAQNYGSVKLSAALQYRFHPNSILALESSYTRFTGALYQNAVYRWQPELLGLQLQMIYEF